MLHGFSEHMDEVLEDLENKLLEGVTVEQRLRGLSLEERLAGLSEAEKSRLRELLEQKRDV